MGEEKTILFREKENKTLKHSLLHGDDRESKKKRRLKEFLYTKVQGSFKAFIASQKREEDFKALIAAQPERGQAQNKEPLKHSLLHRRHFLSFSARRVERQRGGRN